MSLVAGVLLSLYGHAQIVSSPSEASLDSRANFTAHGQRFMAVTANPYATDAAFDVLKAGGTAMDAAIAAQMVLNLVEPQSSGIGGGGFLIHYDARKRQLRAYDGRETAPAAATSEMFLGPNGTPLDFLDAVVGGRSVGVPGLLRMLELAYRRHGGLAWPRLFEAAIRLADEGFIVSPRLHEALASDRHLTEPRARRYFYDAAGKPWQAGHRLKNPDFASVLRRISAEGADVLYRGRLAKEIVDAVRGHELNPGGLSEADLSGYRAQEREPLCGTYRSYLLCGMPPPSSGTSTVLAILGVLERFNLKEVRPNSAFAAHLFSEAGRLAYADRNRYVADPDFVFVPTDALLSRPYLDQRSRLVRFDSSMGRAQAGKLPGTTRRETLVVGGALELPSTSHLSVVDAMGNAVSMTTSIESEFGSRLMVEGFLLNNELTDFSFLPAEDGHPIANRVEPGKRPRSSMAPMMAFDRAGRLKIVIGSPGGSQIINYVGQALVASIDWGMTPDAAVALPHVGSRNGPTELEAGTGAERLKATLVSLGHDVRSVEMKSGLHLIQRGSRGWIGFADRRREGTARGN